MQTNIPIAKQPFAIGSKRKKDSSCEEQVLQLELSSLPQKLNDIGNMMQTVATLDNNTATDLTNAINSLAKVLNDKLDTIISLLQTGREKNKNVDEISFNARNTTLEKLRDLKNARSSSVYKLSYNKTHSEVYSNGLTQTPKLVPKKLHEFIHFRDTEDMEELKKKRTVRRIEDEIENLRYHSKIHENKILSIDKKANEILDNILPVEERSRMASKWRQLTSIGQETIERKWKHKQIFLQSDQHMTTLGTKHRQQNSFANGTTGEQTISRDKHCSSTAPLNCWTKPLQPNFSQQREQSTDTYSPGDIEMESPWTLVRNPQKNFQRQQRSPRLNQQH